MTRKGEIRKVSRECRIIEESVLAKIEIDSTAVAVHETLPRTGRMSRKKEHFESLLKAIREENSCCLFPGSGNT